jgi:hypothetical protein
MVNTHIHPQPVKKPRPSFYSRLFSRTKALASGDVLVDGLLVPVGWVDPPVPTSKDEDAAGEYDGHELEDVEDED